MQDIQNRVELVRLSDKIARLEVHLFIQSTPPGLADRQLGTSVILSGPAEDVVDFYEGRASFEEIERRWGLSPIEQSRGHHRDQARKHDFLTEITKSPLK